MTIAPADSKKERIQKLLAQAGICSRREAESWISAGEVTVNGKAIKLGDKAELGKDYIKVRGKLVLKPEPKIYVVFYKPRETLSVIKNSSEQDDRPTIGDFLSRLKTRVFPVGKLDFLGEGLLLLTNDGDFSESMQKKVTVPWIYEIKATGQFGPETFEKILGGGKVDGTRVQPIGLKPVERLQQKSLLKIALATPDVALFRKYLKNKGVVVDRMKRIAVGNIKLGEMKPGEFRYLKESQVQALVNQPELGFLEYSWIKK